MTRTRTAFERLRHTFWVLPALGIVFGAWFGLVLARVDRSIELPEAISFSAGTDTAASLLQAIITLAVSVAGISFSVIVVALVLASQQLSPRVLRSFQRNSLNQAVLAIFLGTAIFAICVLSAVGDDPAEPVPELSVTLAIVLAALSLGLFVVFLHHVLRSLNASAVIRRIAAEGQQAVEQPYPEAVGCEPSDTAAAEAEFDAATGKLAREEVSAPRAGYLATVKGTKLLDLAAEADVLIEQRAVIGDFVLTGAVIAVVWGSPDAASGVAADAGEAFVLNEERMVDHDIAFPIRQLADVALKGLSPSVNDPTTSENAMDSMTDTLVRAARHGPISAVRLDERMTARLKTVRPGLEQLIRLGFDQVRRDGARRPSFSVRLLELLAELRKLGGEAAADSGELSRQAALIARESIARAETDADRALIERAYTELHAPEGAEMEGIESTPGTDR